MLIFLFKYLIVINVCKFFFFLNCFFRIVFFLIFFLDVNWDIFIFNLLFNSCVIILICFKFILLKELVLLFLESIFVVL